jgi:hypothetical protein
MDKAEAMCHYASIPESWWDFSVEQAVHVYNQTPIRHLEWKTPYELLNGEQPDMSDLKVFDCGAWVWIHLDRRKDKPLKSQPMTFIDYLKDQSPHPNDRVAENDPPSRPLEPEISERSTGTTTKKIWV